MDSDQSSIAADGELTPRPYAVPFQTSDSHIEEVQILVLGAPGTGKTRLQTRYTLRQFVDLVGENAHRIGGHKYLQMLDGVHVHVMIQELSGRRTKTESATTAQERCFRRRLLEKADAVMLLFNPWSQKSFDWIDDALLEDIFHVGEKRHIDKEIVKFLHGLVPGVTPERIMTKTTAKIYTVQKPLPRLPESPTQDQESRDSFPDEKKEFPVLSQSKDALILSSGKKQKAKHDSGISFDSESSTSDRYSRATTVVDAQPRTLADLDRSGLKKPEAQSVEVIAPQTPLTRRLPANSEIPVIVVATITDCLVENGGRYPREVTAEQGQQLARRLGPESAYIELSARSNANVDEAFGIIVDQIVIKKRQERRATMTRDRLERMTRERASFHNKDNNNKNDTNEEDISELSLRPTTTRKQQRSCMPGGAMLMSLMSNMASLSTMMNGVGRALFSGPPNSDVTHSGEDDVWGDMPGDQRSERPSQRAENRGVPTAKPPVSSASEMRRLTADKLSPRTMCHRPDRPGTMLIRRSNGSAFLPPVGREQTTLQVSEEAADGYKTVLKVMNPDTHQEERPPHHAILSRRQSEPNLTSKGRNSDNNGMDGFDAKGIDIKQRRQTSAAVVATAADTALNVDRGVMVQSELPPSYDSAVPTDVGAANQVPLQSQPRYDQQRLSEKARKTMSAMPAPHEKESDTTMAVQRKTHRRTSTLSVIFRPVSRHLSLGGPDDRFVLLLSPSETAFEPRTARIDSVASTATDMEADNAAPQAGGQARFSFLSPFALPLPSPPPPPPPAKSPYRASKETILAPPGPPSDVLVPVPALIRSATPDSAAWPLAVAAAPFATMTPPATTDDNTATAAMKRQWRAPIRMSTAARYNQTEPTMMVMVTPPRGSTRMTRTKERTQSVASTKTMASVLRYYTGEDDMEEASLPLPVSSTTRVSRLPPVPTAPAAK